MFQSLSSSAYIAKYAVQHFVNDGNCKLTRRALCIAQHYNHADMTMTEITTTPHVEIYTSPFCGFCVRAKSLLDHKGVTYDEIDVMMDGSRRTEMTERAQGGTSVPQIFINGEHVGGCNELLMMEHQGQLDSKLGAA
jgi:glutaredoxin 3